MDRESRIQAITVRFWGVEWNMEEETICFHIFFRKCWDLLYLNNPVVFNSIWLPLAIELSAVMQKLFSKSKVRTKIHRLRTHFNEFITFNSIPGIRENKLEWYFRTYGFSWYHHCVDVFDLQEAPKIDFDDGTSGSEDDPIFLDESDSDFSNVNKALEMDVEENEVQQMDIPSSP
ncbi:potassium voltage-gated channel subfamily Hmember 2 [Striga asiatica]|uniref:Potassium voltage-gated channel subfamily Hmember 2 n=1 Tax=Striga asiatica TaxID=4170 RepID=A0A5A7P8I1_STRAF|nr:potassium voltage-gated channel subfamily Hmember 2 [Striga asiatica]